MKQLRPYFIASLLLSIALAAAVLSLSGCAGAGLTDAEEAALTPEQKIFKIAGDINAAFEPAVKYAQQPRCEGGQVVGCHDPSVVRALLKLRQEATAALEVAKANPNDAQVALLTRITRRILTELQAELLKAQTQGALHGQKYIIAFA